jgi:multiple sugar transport system permease protein
MSRDRRDSGLPIGVLVASLLFLVLVQGYPFAWAAAVSLRNQLVGGKGAFVGFANYLQLGGDPTFRASLNFTLIYVFGAVVLKLVLGYVMAAMLNQPIPFRGFFRAILFLPWALPTLTSVLAWRWMLGDVGGVFNYLLQHVGLIDRPVGWLGIPVHARIAAIAVNVWRGTPFFGISILAAMQSISPELYEVARIDGAGAWRRFVSITLPSISAVLLLVTLISTIWTLGDFAIIWLLTRGGPANTTQVFSTYSYVIAFQNMQLSKGIAVALSIVPLSVVLMVLTMRFISGQKEAR